MNEFVDFLTRNFTKTWFGFATALLMSILTIAIPIYLQGFRETADMRSHLSFAHAFQAAFRNGEPEPGWQNDNLGFGSVGTRFYPPLSASFSAIAEFATGDWHLAYSLSVFLWMLVGCFGMFLFVREWSSPAFGILAGMLYSVVPYHVAEMYRFFLYAEFAGMAALPYCFLYLTRLCRRGSWSSVIPLALSGSVLVLTHIPVTVMLAFSALVYIPIVIDRSNWKKISVQLISTAAIVAAATAFFWIRIVTEVSWVAHSGPRYTVPGYAQGPMLFPYQLVDYDITYLRPFFRHFDIVTVLTIALLIPSIVALIVGRAREQSPSRRIIVATTLSAGLGIFMFSKPSAFLWNDVEIFQRLQYPWRWLSIVSFFAVASIALSLGSLVNYKWISLNRSLYGGMLLIAAFAAVDIRQIRSTPYRISREQFNELAEVVQSEKIAEHWWPIWAMPEAFENTQPVSAGYREVRITSWEAKRRTFSVEKGNSMPIRIATFYYPYWHAKVDGYPVEVDKAPDGTMTIPISDGRTEVDLRFEEPARYRIASGSSIVASLFMIAVLMFQFLRGMVKGDGVDPHSKGEVELSST